VGTYQFRRDGVGWECREIIGKGADRKRTYLAHLSRAHYERMKEKASTEGELTERLLEWADGKRERSGREGQGSDSNLLSQQIASFLLSTCFRERSRMKDGNPSPITGRRKPL
jgi:hypothetical protein